MAIPNTPGPEVETFRQGLRDLGYIEGKNITIEYRGAEGKQDRIPGLVSELVQIKVDVLIITSSASDPRSQAGDTDDPHCDGDDCGSRCDGANR